MSSVAQGQRALPAPYSEGKSACIDAIWLYYNCHMASTSVSNRKRPPLTALFPKWVLRPADTCGERWITVYANLIEDKALLRKRSNSDVQIVIQGLHAGLPVESIHRLGALMGKSQRIIAEAVQIPTRTLSRRKRFKPSESDRIFRLSHLFQRAAEVLGNIEETRRWFSSPRKALGGKTPMELSDTDIGAREVEDLLGRIEHGVFS